jgi:uncharacterized protein YdiU (UPF0061 family)
MQDYSDLSEKKFSNLFTEKLPGDHAKVRDSRQVLGACYSLIEPEVVSNPKLLAWSEELARNFQLNKPSDPSLDLQILAGNKITDSMQPYAACYGGHQFGNWAGQLGDGRAITLGELADIKGEVWDLQLKGAGKTPYSRNADGRAVLRSSLREFLASEAMFHLGIPTTRALSLVSTGDAVIRDMFYNGNPKYEKGAIVSRMAPSFLRFGNYEIHTARQQIEVLKKLVDWTITKYFQEINLDSSDAYANFFLEVCKRTAKLMVEWERVGFVHGVLNTDNMSILGLSIDYGPFGWLDVYDPLWTPNTTDMQGRRYCFGQQASIAQWNLQCLAEALKPILNSSSSLKDGLNIYLETYKYEYLKMMEERMGLAVLKREHDFRFLSELNRVLRLAEVDWTLFFRSLAKVEAFSESGNDSDFNFVQINNAIYGEYSLDFKEAMSAWLLQYSQRIRQDDLSKQQRIVKMNKKNPKFIPRNYLLYQVIQDLEVGKTESFRELFSVLKNPYDENLECEHLAVKRPAWAKNTVGSSTLSCSS